MTLTSIHTTPSGQLSDPHAWNRTEREYAGPDCVQEWIEQQASQTPEAVALVFEQQRLSYGELNARANQLANALRARGIGAESLVGVCLERSLEMVIGLLGVMKAGAAYVPLDPDYPAERLQYVIQDIGAQVVLTQGKWKRKLAIWSGIEALTLDEDWPQIALASTANPELRTLPSHLAYVIYTSGSTGKPKGAMNEHAGLRNRLLWMQEQCGLDAGDVVLQKTPYSFDVSVWEFFWPLMRGACLVIARPEGHRDPLYLARLIEIHRVTTIHFVPSMLRPFLETGETWRAKTLKRVVCSGEALTPELVKAFSRHFSCELLNLYGPTEAAIDVTCWRCDNVDPNSMEAGSTTPIGRPIANTQTYILDDGLNPVPVGEAGELYLGGVQVGRGYLRRPELTAERFVPDPFSTRPGTRLYRTGDRARYLKDGVIEYLGRIDFQVKISGFRIEPGEIESVLLACPGVREAVVIVRTSHENDRHLIAYVVPARKADVIREGTYELPNGRRIFHQNAGETDFLYREIFATETYLKHGIILKEDAVVLDVGANIGMFALFIGEQCPRATIHAFEPLPPIFDTLKKNASLTEARMNVYQLGLSSEDEETEFTYYRGNSIMSGVKSEGDREEDIEVARQLLRSKDQESETDATSATEELLRERMRGTAYRCQLRRLSSLMREQTIEHVDLLKIDVERGEWSVLQGIDQEDWSRIDQVALEVHDRVRDQEESGVARVVAFLKQRGYEVEAEEDEAMIGSGLFNVFATRYTKKVRAESATRQRPASPPVTPLWLQKYLLEKLPEHMVPSMFVVLPELPLTSSGKIDRLALPEPKQRGESERVMIAPRTAEEEVVAELFCKVLNAKAVGVTDDFFNLGGHSLQAMRFINRLRSQTGVELSVNTMFAAPTVAALAAEMTRQRKAARESDQTRWQKADPDTPAELSFAQERMFFLQSMDPASVQYNVRLVLRLTGPCDADAMTRAMAEIVQRHEVLRTVFPLKDDLPVQRVQAMPETWLEPVELTESQLRGFIAREVHRPFDLSHGPVLRSWLVRLGPQEHALLLVVHHVAVDDWSMELLARELSLLYNVYAAGGVSPLPALRARYSDYARWQRSKVAVDSLQPQLAYWKQQLADLPMLELPSWNPSAASRSKASERRQFAFAKPLLHKLNELSKQEGVTLFMTLLAAFNLALRRYSGQDDLVVGAPVSSRSIEEVEGLIGLFVNSLVLRTNLSGDPTVRELLQRVRKTALGGFDNADVPFEKLVEELRPERYLGRMPLFQVMFVTQNSRDIRWSFDGLEVSDETPLPDEEKFDLTLLLDGDREGLQGTLSYVRGLFDSALIAGIVSSFELALEQMVLYPEKKIAQLDLLSREQEQTVLVGWNQMRRDYPGPGCIHEWIEDQVSRTPSAVALKFQEREVAYQELNAQANQVAHFLRARGIGPESTVGICMERSVETVVAILGILKAGGAYVPLDPEFPADRLQYVIEDSGARVVLTQEKSKRELAIWPGLEAICLDSEWFQFSSLGRQNPERLASLANLAYVIYTSGSTGRPKGAMNEHRALRSHLLWMQEEIGLDRSDVVLQKTPYSFDVSVWEFLWTLMRGACLVIAKPGGHRDPVYLARLIEAQGVTTVHFVPSMLRPFLDSGEAWRAKGLKRLMFGGEAITPELVKEAGSQLSCQLHNLYGPTEAAIDVAHWRCDDKPVEAFIPIGRPVANTQLYILDADLKPVPAGVTGELYIGGIQVGRGYMGKPALTAERFLPDAFSTQPGARVYRTGDRVRFGQGGVIEFLGRFDFQVKVHGFRIELGEIEAVLMRHAEVRESVAMVWGKEDDQRIVAYVVASAGCQIDTACLRVAAQKTLPPYMVPSALVVLPRLPLTTSGKLDRAALPAPEYTLGQHSRSPRSPREEILCGFFEEVLGVTGVGIDDNFFDLGGHSLLAMRLVGKIENALQMGLSLRTVFDSPTVAGLSEAFEQRVASDVLIHRPAIVTVSRSADLPISYEEELFFRFQDRGFNLAVTVSFDGILHREALEQALDQIVSRHEVLRSTYKTNGDVITRLIRHSDKCHLQAIDLTHQEVARQQAAVTQWLTESIRAPFDLAKGPLYRFQLLRLTTEKHILVFTLHHIVCDAWSEALLMSEIITLYQAFVGNQPSPVAPLRFQYADYSAWRRRLGFAAALSYWRQKLTDVPSLLPLPADAVRPPVPNFAGGRVLFAVDANQAHALETMSRQHGVTLFMLLLAIFKLLLFRLTRETRICLSAPMVNRVLPELEEMVGLFVNSVIFYTDLRGASSFAALLARVRDTSLEAYTHQEMPMTTLVQELGSRTDGSHLPLAQVLFDTIPAPPSSLQVSQSSSVRPYEWNSEIASASRFDLVLTYEGAADGRLEFSLLFNSGLFSTVRMREVAAQYQTLVEQIMAAPATRLEDYSLVSAASLSLLPDLAASPVITPQPTLLTLPTLLERFAAQVRDRPDAPALVAGAGQWSYRDLEATSDRIARHLLASGVGRGEIVALPAGNSGHHICAALGILKAGAALALVDPNRQSEQERQCLQAAGPAGFIQVGQQFAPDWPWRFRVDFDQALLADEPAGYRLPSVTAEDAAYVTVLDTNFPATICHRRLAGYADWLVTACAMGANDTVAVLDDPAHPAFMQQALAAICVGARLQLAGGDAEATVWSLNPHRWREMESVPQKLRLLLLNGDAVYRHDILRMRELAPQANCASIYMAVRMPAFCSGLIVPAGEPVTGEVLPIGKGIAGTELVILNHGGTLAGIGEPGLLHLRTQPENSLTMTGEAARYLPDGNVEWLGREDDRGSLHGYQIRFAEIEAVLAHHSAVQEAAVRIESSPNSRLTAYVVSRPGQSWNAESLTKFLRWRLPHHSVPASFVAVDAIPLDRAGRTDRARLHPKPERNPPPVPVAARQSGPLSGARQIFDPESGSVFRPDGVYLVSGGAGGLGLLFAREIAAKAKGATLILTGRSALTGEKRGHLSDIETAGARVEYLQVDVSDRHAVTALIHAVEANHGRLDGVLHSAGIVRDSTLPRKTGEDVQAVLAPKVRGLVNLDEATRHLPLDFFVCFSSLAGALGNIGQSDYATANAFMDAYAAYRSGLVRKGERSGRSLSIDWPLWAEGGMRADTATITQMRSRSGLTPLDATRGLQAFYQALALNRSQVVVTAGEGGRIKRGFAKPRKTAAPPVSTPPAPLPVKPAAPMAAAEMADKVNNALLGIVSDLLKVTRHDLDLDAELSEFGFDSVSLTTLSNSLNDLFRLELTPTIFFEYPTLRSFAAYLMKEHRQRVEDKFHVPAVTTQVSPPPQQPVRQSPVRSRAPLTTPSGPPAVDTTAIAIIGMSGRFPQALDLDAFWENLKAGKDCITEIPPERWDWRSIQDQTQVKWGGFIAGVEEFDSLFFGISPGEADVMDPQQRLLLTYAWKAIEDAGYAPQSLWGSRTAVFAGTGESGYSSLMNHAKLAISAQSAIGVMPSVGPNRISYLLNLRGPSEPVETACSSSLVAIHRAMLAINSDQCDLAIAGGVNTLISPGIHIGLSRAGMLSPHGRCKTFSPQADGYVRGEGVGVLLLKKLSAAERDGDHIYAVLRGSAENHGGRANSLTSPNPVAQTELLKSAYTRAGIDPRTVSYIEAHGTGTSLGDPIEINALKQAFRELYQATGDTQVAAPHCALGSVKSNIGHLELAAGIAGVIKVLLQMKHKTLVTNLHCEQINPYIQLEGSPFRILREPAPWRSTEEGQPLRAGVSSFGAWGVNVHLVLEEYASKPQRSPASRGPVVIVLSARNKERLLEQSRLLLDALSNLNDRDLPSISYTLQVGRDAMESRLAFIVSGIDELRDKLRRFAGGDATIEECYYGEAKRSQREVFSGFTTDADAGTLIETWVAKGKYAKLLDLWVKGFGFDWNLLYGEGDRPGRISLPSYPFAPERHWVPVLQQAQAPEAKGHEESHDLLFYAERWREAPPAAAAVRLAGAVVCFGTEAVWHHPLIEAGFSEPLVFIPGEGDFDISLQQARETHGGVVAVLFLSALENRHRVSDYASIQKLVRAVGREVPGCQRVILAGEFGDGLERAYLESWMGLERSIKLVLPDTTVTLLLSAADTPLEISSLAQKLWQELTAARPESALYQEGRRYVSRVERAPFVPSGANPTRMGGRYLITGGAGGLGRLLARYLAQRYSAKLVLTGRSPLATSVQRDLAELVQLGGEVRYVQADVCDVGAMRAGIEAAEQEWGAIQGVVHAAGLAGGKSILENDEASFARVLAPKVNGTLALEEVLRGRALDFVCYFSSASAVLGDFGGCDYAIGNRFELAYADHRERERALGRMQGRTVAIAWPRWDGGSMGVAEESESMQLYLKSSGQRVLRSEEGLELWERLLAGGSSSWLVMAGRPSRVDRYLGVSASPVPAAATVTSAVRMKPVTGRRVEMRGLSVEQCVLWDLREQASDQLKLGRERLDTEENLAEFGFDSIGLAQYAQRLSHYYGLEIVPSVFFSHPTLGRLSKHLAISHGEALAAFYGETSFTSAGVVKSEPVAVTITPSRSVPASSDYEPIAIVGRSGRFPGARNVDEMWRVLLEGRTTVTEIPGDRFDWREQYGEGKSVGKSVGKWCGSLSGVWEFDPLFFEISPREAEGMDPRQRLLLQECWLALENAGYGAAQLASQKVGVFVGVEAGDYGLLRGSGGLTSSNDGILAARLGYFLNLHGPAMAINTTCSSGLVALHQGCQSLRLGESDTVIAAGVNLLLTPYGYQTMSAAGMLSADGCCYAFDRRANGMVPGEAVVAVVLKRLRDAEASGDPIHGVIRGSGINYDGRTNGITAPNGESQTGLLREVYARSGVDVERVEYIVTHGTGTHLGDPIEIQALCAAYGEQRRGPGYCALTSSKTNFGHTFAASGLVSLLGLVEAMKGETIPASLHCEQESSYIRWDESPFYVNKANRPWPRGEQSRVGAVSAFGMSGTNAHVVVESYEGVEEAGIEAPYYLLVCSGRSEAALQERLRMLGESLSSGKWSGGQLAAVSQTLLSGRHHFAWRCAVVVTDAENGKYLLGVGERGESAGNVYRGKVERDKGGRASLQQYGESLLGESWEWMENSPARYRESLEALGDLYCQGYELGWEKLYGGRRLRRVELPGYPFAREHYGPGMEPVASAEPVRQSRYLRKGWVGSEPAAGGSLPSGVLLLASAGSQELAQGLAERLVGARVLGVDQPPPEDIDWSAVGGCIDLAACEPGERSLEWIGWLQRIIEGRGQSSNRPLLLGVTYGLESCGEAAPVFSAGAALRAGLYRMLESESRAVRSRHVDLEAGCVGHAAVEQILHELRSGGEAFEVCWRNGRRFQAALEEIATTTITDPESRGDRRFPPDEVLWVTGGTRGLGLLCARHFVRQWGVRKLLLSGRESLPPRAEWITHYGRPNKVGERIRELEAAIAGLEADGAEVVILSAPLNDARALKRELDQVKSGMGRIGGVLHCAGRVGAEAPALVRKSLAGIGEVLEPKVSGLDNLLAAVQGEPLAFVVLFSSVSGTVPSLAVGQSDYAMANAYMDYVAEVAGAGSSLVSVQWPSWKETGMGEARSRAYAQTGLLSHSDEEGLGLLDEVLMRGLGPVVLPAVVDATIFHPSVLLRGRAPVMATQLVAETRAAAATGWETAARDWFAGVVSEHLKIPRERLEADKPLTEYGVDSVILVSMLRPVAELVGTAIDPSLLFEHPTIAKFAKWLTRSHGDKLAHRFTIEEPIEAALLWPALPVPALEKSERKADTSLDIAVVGMSCRFPGAPNVDAYWRLLAEGRSAIGPVPPERWSQDKGFQAAVLENVTEFNTKYFQIPEVDARVMDPQALLLLEESVALWYHAGYHPEEVKGSSIGVYLGARSQHRPDAESLNQARNPIVASGQNYLASNISRHFDLHGPSLVVDTACSSALVAMSMAIHDLEREQVSAAVVGGVSLLESDAALRLFAQRGILNQDPVFHLFDRRAQGAVLGEGAGMVLLKRLDQAKADGDRIYAVVKALAINNDGRTAGPTAPNVQAQKDVMRAALARSGKQAGEIGYIEVNGSGTEVSDLLELKAIESVYRLESRQPCELGSIKPNIGHPLTAEAIASVIKVVLMLHHRQRVPFLSAREPMEHYDLAASPFRFTRELTEWTVHPVAAVNCFADGGTNAHIILEAPPAVQARRSPLPPPQLLKDFVRTAQVKVATPIPLHVTTLSSDPTPWRSAWEQSSESGTGTDQILLGTDHPVMRNHRVYGRHLLPGVAYVDLLYQFFAQRGYGFAELELRNLSIYHPCAVSDQVPLLLDVDWKREREGFWRVTVLGRERYNDGTHGESMRYASAEMHPVSQAVFSDRLDFAAMDQAAELTTRLQDFYAACRPCELVHGDFMQGQGRLYHTPDAMYLECSLGEDATPTAKRYLFHPALMDCSVVCTGTILKASSIGEQGADQRLILPLFYQSFRASEPLPADCIVRVRHASVREKNQLIYLTVEFFHREGRKLAELKDFVVKLVREPGLINPERRVAAAPPAPVVQVQPLRTEAERSSVLAMLRQLLGEQLQIAADQVDAAAGYYEMGLTSAGLLEMVRRLESRVGTSLSPTLLFEYTTLLELADYLESKYPEQFAVKQTSSSPAPASSPVTTAVVAVKEPRRDGENLPFAAAEPIAIVGMSGRFAQAENLHQFWENLKAARDCITEVPPETLGLAPFGGTALRVREADVPLGWFYQSRG